MDKIARLMTNVRIIEQWLQKNVYVDSIKRAFVESISNTYRTEFANIVIDMRTKVTKIIITLFRILLGCELMIPVRSDKLTMRKCANIII